MRKKELYASPQTEVMDFSPGQMLCASVGPGDFGTGNLPGLTLTMMMTINPD